MLDNATREHIATQGISHARKVGKEPPAVKRNQHTPEELLIPIVSTRPDSRRCRGCSGHLDEITVGCNSCRNRHTARRNALKRHM